MCSCVSIALARDERRTAICRFLTLNWSCEFMDETNPKPDTVHVHAERIQNLIKRIFDRAGCDAAESERIATRLTGANLRGHDSHGILRTPRYVEWIGSGRVLPNQTISLELENETIAVINGNYGFGQSVGEQTVDIGIEKALANGVGVTALKNAGHLGRIGDWAERAAAANCASIHMVNVRGSLLTAPFGAIQRRGSTSPFCAGIPVEGSEPIVLDFATALVAEGKALVAMRGGKALPNDALVSTDGTLTGDPTTLYGDLEPGRSPDASKGTGALRMFGDHKGAGLNFFMEMFAGALTGSGTAGALGESERRRFCNGMLSIYLSVEFFHSDDWFANEVRNYVAFWKSAKSIDGNEAVLVPGEPERRTMAERLSNGIPLSADAWGDIQRTANSVGINDAEMADVVM
jgi:uncharacterized oxidoreductase